MPLPTPAIHTIEDIYNLPEGTRAELLDGQIYYMAPPTRKHQRLVGEVYYRISNHIKTNSGPCEVNVSPFAVFLDADDSKYVEPDICVVCDPNQLDDKGCHGAPDWIIEVVSPGTRRMDYYTKLAAYKGAGVRLYWIIDIDKKTIVVYDLEAESIPAIYHFSDIIPVSIYPNFSIDFSSIVFE